MVEDQKRQSGAEQASGSSPGRRRWLRLLFLLVSTYVGWCAGLYICQDWLMFPAEMAPEPLPLGYQHQTTIEFVRPAEGGGEVVAWFLPVPGADAEDPAPVVVFFHGNAEIIDHQHTIVEGYHRLGCSVLLPEYRGYGRSAGLASEEAIVADAVHFHDELVGRPEVDEARVVIHGRSLGGGPAAQLAARRGPRALVLESTFSSAARMAHKYLVPAFLVKHPFRTDRVLETLDAAVLIFHGSGDDVIPVSHGRRLGEIALRGTYVEYPCAHNDFPGLDNEAAYWDQIAEFLRDGGIIEDIEDVEQ